MADLAGMGRSLARCSQTRGCSAAGRECTFDHVELASRLEAPRQPGRLTVDRENLMSLSTLEEIRDVLQHRRKHCRDLLELSLRQHRIIDAADYTQLMSTLAQKQQIGRASCRER